MAPTSTVGKRSCSPGGVVLQASGFCYVNDIVLACLELLKYHQRVRPSGDASTVQRPWG